MWFYDNPQSLDSNDDDDDDKVQLQLIANVSMRSGKNPQAHTPTLLPRCNIECTSEILRLTLPHFLLIVMIDEQMMIMSSHYCTCLHQMQLTGCRHPVTTTKFVNTIQYNTTLLYCIHK